MCCYDLSMFNTQNEIPAMHLKPVGTGGIKFWGSCGRFQKKYVMGKFHR